MKTFDRRCSKALKGVGGGGSLLVRTPLIVLDGNQGDGLEVSIFSIMNEARLARNKLTRGLLYSPCVTNTFETQQRKAFTICLVYSTSQLMYSSRGIFYPFCHPFLPFLFYVFRVARGSPLCETAERSVRNLPFQRQDFSYSYFSPRHSPVMVPN